MKHILITGGGAGLGAYLALNFANLGHKVSIIGKSDDGLVAIALQNKRIFAEKADVTQPLNTAFEKCVKHHGRIDVVIANVGEGIFKPFMKSNLNDLKSVVESNLYGVFNTFQPALPDMLKYNEGRLIAISSVAGLRGYSNTSAYAAAKHGVNGLVKSLALELAQTNITVNAVCPFLLDTPMTNLAVESVIKFSKRTTEEATEALMRNNPQGRFIGSDEVFETIKWLMSDGAKSVNGQCIALSGGNP